MCSRQILVFSMSIQTTNVELSNLHYVKMLKINSICNINFKFFKLLIFKSVSLPNLPQLCLFAVKSKTLFCSKIQQKLFRAANHFILFIETNHRCLVIEPNNHSLQSQIQRHFIEDQTLRLQLHTIINKCVHDSMYS